jgi:GTP cyclohydrolase I
MNFQNRHQERLPSYDEAVAAIRLVLQYIGENPEREGLCDTPDRVVRSFDEYFGGYKMNPEDHLEVTFTETDGFQEMVTLRDIPFSSHCEHHMAPIIGTATISYLPDQRVVGISKLARVVDVFSRRLQTQEKLTSQICNAIQDGLKPKGVKVAIVAEHHCMKTRGVQKHGVVMETECSTGALSQD